MASRKRKVADFPEEMLAAWTLAADGKLFLEFDAEGKAKNFRQQLHTFRKAWVNENGPGSCQRWFEVDLILEPKEDKFILTSGVIDWKKQIREQADAAGVPAIPLLPHAKIEAPTALIPPGIPVQVSAYNPAPVEEINDAVSRGLEKLGFSSKP